MSTTSEFPADVATRVSADERTTHKVFVWDAPVRLFHWLMVICFAGAYVTAESEYWRMLHVTLGYTMAGLVGFRIIWGVIGSRYARFSAFVRGPSAVARYLSSIVRGRPEHHTGHNPAGAWAIVALLLLTLAVAASGWATYNDIAGEWLEELHEVVANLMLAIIGVHVAGVLMGSWLHGENLVAAMISGRKSGRAEDGIRSAWCSVSVLMLAAVLSFWWMQWQAAPLDSSLADRPAATAKTPDHDR